jgi:5,10-methylenetetrahydromethanopterin reductase
VTRKTETAFARVGLYVRDHEPIPESVANVRLAEERGFCAAWQASPRLGRDATIPLALFATQTSHVTLGSATVTAGSRNIGVLASTFVSLDDLAPGRVVLGLSAWWNPIASSVGVRLASVEAEVRETIEACRELFTLNVVNYSGTKISLRNAKIDVAGPARSIPIYLGAMGPRMLRLAGEVADGVILNYMLPTTFLDAAIAQIEAGASRAGRDIGEIDRPQLVLCSVSEDPAHAVRATQEYLVEYFATQPETLKRRGVDAELVDEVNQAIRQAVTADAADARIREVAELVPIEAVHELSATGTPSECRQKVSVYLSHGGGTYPVVAPILGVRETIEAFAPTGVRS